jgi:hypothetical protein
MRAIVAPTPPSGDRVGMRLDVRVENEQEKVPAALRTVFDEIVAITDDFCAEHLDDEYARLSRSLTAKLTRKRPSPLARGDRRIWAAGIVNTIGRVNFLSDPDQRPHLRTDELARLLGVRAQTMGNKSRQIEDVLGIGSMDPAWSRQDMIAKNPNVWFVELDGFVVDARSLPEELQVQAWELGLIPYVPSRQ